MACFRCESEWVALSLCECSERCVFVCGGVLLYVQIQLQSLLQSDVLAKLKASVWLAVGMTEPSPG